MSAPPVITTALCVSAAPQPAAPSTATMGLAQIAVLALLLAAPALVATHLADVSDPDLWWHLRTGEWILQHHAIPHTDPFSIFGAGKSWQAYSWLFELLVLKLFRSLGLPGIVAYTSSTLVAITAATFHLARRLQKDLTLAILLTFITCLSLSRLYAPRPWLLSILLFVLEIDILFHARRTGRVRELLWLPILFVVWANVHIQFVDGLLVLALAAAASMLPRRLDPNSLPIRPAFLLGTLIASIAFTCLNPYGWRIYAVAQGLATQPGVFNSLVELQAMPFRDWSDFALLLLALASVAVLARAPLVAPFESALLLLAVLGAFRSQRDAWLLAVVSTAVLAAGIVLPAHPSRPDTRLSFHIPGALVFALLLVIAGFRVLHITEQSLATQLANNLPVHAVDAVEARHFSGPLYNPYAWGGYLIWRLRQPVSLDGRALLHGDERIARSNATWSGSPDWATDPELQAAHLILAPVASPLTQLLRLQTRYQLAFKDDVAAVFVLSSEERNCKSDALRSQQTDMPSR